MLRLWHLHFHYCLLLGLLAGCRSARLADNFVAAPLLASIAYPLTQAPVSEATVTYHPTKKIKLDDGPPGTPGLQVNRQALPRQQPIFRVCRVVAASQTKQVKQLVSRLARQPSAPAMNGGQASFLLATVALLLGVGGILLLRLLGGWVGISGGILLLLLALYLGLFAGLLGEFDSDKPFRFVDLLTL
jgi:hypothetical protein